MRAACFRFHLLRALVLAAGLLASRAAVARPEPTEAELAQARERFGAARKLENAGRWSDALELLQRVAEVKMTPQVRFHLALCAESVGLWTQALAGYEQAAGEAGVTAPDVLREANEHRLGLEATIPTVSVHVNGAAAGDVLALDLRAVPLDERAPAMRADPGTHLVEVRRGDAVVARLYFTLAPKAARRIELNVGEVAPALPPSPPGSPGPPVGSPAPVPPAGSPAAVPPSGGEHPKPDGAPPATSSDGHVQRALAVTALGVGGASVVLAGVFLGLRAGAIAEVGRACPAWTHCLPSLAPTVNEGRTYSALVNVFAGLAGAGLVGGAALFVTAPSAKAPPASITNAPAPGLMLSIVLRPDTAGLTLQEIF